MNVFAAALRASLPRRTATAALTSSSSLTLTAAPAASLSAVAAARRAFATNGDISGYDSQVCSVLGAQWGDEGKGKLVDILAERYDVVARFNGGANAGHTLIVDGKKFAFHLLPCGLLHKKPINVIGNGVVLHLPTMFKELASLDDAGIDYSGRLLISDRAHLLFDAHMAVDGAREDGLADAKKIGTTKRGIGPAYSSKAIREGVRVGDLLDFDVFTENFTAMMRDMRSRYGEAMRDIDVDAELERYRAYADIVRPMVRDTQHELNAMLARGKTVLAEGANAALLDVDFGTYPYVTSSATAAGGICTGLGIAPTKIDSVLGVVKAYTTRVGAGPFPTELTDAIGLHLRDVGHEQGTTTGRDRRCGWLDIPVVRFSHSLNNYQALNITKLDVLTGLEELKLGVAYEVDGVRLPDGRMPSTLRELSAVKVVYESMPGWTEDISECTDYDQLPANARAYLDRISELIGVPCSWIGVGPSRHSMLANGFVKQ